MNTRCIPIDSEAGIIWGRDAIFLDEISFHYDKNEVTFVGELNSNLCSKLPHNSEYRGFRLTFTGVMAFQMTELDCAHGVVANLSKSSFDVVENSEWISQMRVGDRSGKLKDSHRHFILSTYDDVFEIVAAGFEFEISQKTAER